MELAKFEMKKISFLAVMTFIVVMVFIFASLYMLIQGKSEFKDFAGSIGPMAGMLLGYWVRDTKGPETE
jgi:predicted neutral ceramidase superfamily lipid hydrolase